MGMVDVKRVRDLELARPLPDDDLRTEFARIAALLADVQEELCAVVVAGSGDPLLESRLAEVRNEIDARRESLLADWARVGLTWVLRGGQIELTMPRPVRLAPPPPPPAPAPPPPPPPPKIEVPPPDLSRLQGDGIAPSWARSEQTRPRAVDPATLAEVLRSIGASPEVIDTPTRAQEEIETLLRAVAGDRTEKWTELPREAQKALVGHVVARARHVQDELEPGVLDASAIPTLDRVFSAMTAYSKREQPGFVFGLMRSHGPQHGSWRADATGWWELLEELAPRSAPVNPERALADLQARIAAGDDTDALIVQALIVLDAGVLPEDPRLVRMMAPRAELLRKHARFKRLRKAIRDAQVDDEEFDAELAHSVSEQLGDWPHKALVEGKRAAVVGGDLREEARRRLEEAFGFKSLEWVTTDHSRNAQTLASAVEGGSIDFVIVLRRFIGHDIDRIVLPACKAAGVPWVSVERGYGITQVSLAISRFLSQSG